jgi:plastocyanin
MVTFTGPPQPTFTASTNSATAGQPFSLSWASADGSSCNATLGGPGDGWAGPRPASGTTQITELTPGPYAFEIKCGIAGESLLGVGVNPAPFVPQPPPPANVQLSFAPSPTFPNQSVTVNWTANGVTACMASGGSGTDGWQGPIPITGSQAVIETTPGSYTFNISCTGGGTVTGQAILVVNPAPTAVLSASATTVDAGQSFTLTWNSTETSGCTATGGAAGDGWSGSEASSGNASVTEAAAGSYSYTVSCTAGPETVQAMAEVVVVASAIGSSGHSGGGGSLDAMSLTALGLLIAVRRRRGCFG